MTNKYLLSFVALSLQVYESEALALLYLDSPDWDIVRHKVIEENYLQKGTLSTRKREFVEFKKRLCTLTQEQLFFYKDATTADSRNLTILSCFKLYPFMYDFAVDVIRNKTLLFDYSISDSDYELFYDSKSIAYDNLASVSESTRKKIKQVMFKIFEQAEFIDNIKNKNIQKPYLSTEMIQLIVQDNPNYLRAFLYSDNDINEYIKRYR